MGDRSKIEWTNASWTPIRARNLKTGRIGWHCEHATPGCEFCYSERLNIRLGTGLPFKPGHRADVEIVLDPKMLLQPLRWKRPRMIFVCSMTDLFGDFVTDAMIDQVFAVMALCPQHTFQVLTKRSARMREMLTAVKRPGLSERVSGVIARMVLAGQISVAQGNMAHARPTSCLPNVWLGVSTEDQRRADERVPDLLATPAAVRFVSAEPLLGPIDFRPWLSDDDGCEGCDDGAGMAQNRCARGDIPREEQCPRRLAVFDYVEHGPIHSHGAPTAITETRRTLDWIIAGGESGPGARPMHPDWARLIRDQCAAAGVPFFFKQYGEYREFDTGSPTVEQVMAGSEHGESVLATAVNPSWITRDGRHIARPDDLPAEGEPGARLIERLGKRRAGRLLDGVTHDGMPSRPTESASSPQETLAHA